MPLLRNEKPKSTNGYSLIINALMFIRNEKALLINGNPNSINGYSLIISTLMFLGNKKALLINGNPNSINGNPFVSIKFSFLGNANPLPTDNHKNKLSKDSPSGRFYLIIKIIQYPGCFDIQKDNLVVHPTQVTATYSTVTLFAKFLG